MSKPFILTSGQKRGVFILLLFVVALLGIRFREQFLQNKADLSEYQAPKAEVPAFKSEAVPRSPIDLNTADTTELMEVRGIGPTFSKRITSMRWAIGGFTSVEQLRELRGLKEEDFLKIQDQFFADTTTEAFREMQAWKRGRRQSASPRRKAPTRGKKPKSYLQGKPKEYPKREYSAWKTQDSTARNKNYSQPAPKPKITQPINLNTADSLALVSVPGIGPKTAYWILRIRNQLGFYHSVDQLKGEVKMIREENFERMKALLFVEDLSALPHLEINQATEAELRKHLYLNYKEARIIANYRMQHGDYSSMEDLRKLYGLREGTLEKISPYLQF